MQWCHNVTCNKQWMLASRLGQQCTRLSTQLTVLAGTCCLRASPCRAEAAICNGTLQQLAVELRQELAALSSKDYSGHSLLQLKKQGLIIDLMHSCDVVEGLLGSSNGQRPPTSPEDWAWARQLRYYSTQVGSTVRLTARPCPVGLCASMKLLGCWHGWCLSPQNRQV